MGALCTEIIKLGMKIKEIILIISAGLFVSTAAAREKSKAYLEYIDKYNSIAVSDMKTYGIPASITLAQGLLESGAGKSELSRLSNNHFGIKCHDWKGEKVYFDDDRKGECFRKYDDPKDSYRDHALFLKERPRYASLFELKTTDYKGWATGLKKCGYATDPNYASRLVDIIEFYGLSEYDKDVKVKVNVAEEKKEKETKEIRKHYQLNSTMGSINMLSSHNVTKKGKKSVVIAEANDTYESLAEEFGLRKWEIRRYNKVKKGATPNTGDEIIVKIW